MDLRLILNLIVTADAFAGRGDNQPTTISVPARSAAGSARAVLVRRLTAAHLSGAGMLLDTKSLAGMIRELDRLIAEGDGREPMLAQDDTEALLAYRSALVDRIEHAHPGGDTIVELLPPPPRVAARGRWPQLADAPMLAPIVLPRLESPAPPETARGALPESEIAAGNAGVANGVSTTPVDFSQQQFGAVAAISFEASVSPPGTIPDPRMPASATPSLTGLG